MPFHLTIKPLNSAVGEFPVDVDETLTVQELKEQIAGRVSLNQSHIRLVCSGRVWADAQTVASYAPSEGAVVHCLNNPPREAPSAQAQTLQAADPMQQMMGGMPPPPAGVSEDPMDQMMRQAQQQMMQNPEMMQQMMSSPMMQQMLSDPETMRAMMRMNPQLNRLMEQRPEIARLLEDPEMLRQSMQMATNPALMREMMRNSDRALGNLDVMPGGHNALRRAHEEFADPLYEAMTAGGQDGAAGPAVDYSQTTSGAPNTAALPNAWGAPATPAPAATPAAATPAQSPAPTAPSVPPTPAAPTAAAGGNPMAAMMQQMMMGGMPGMPAQPAATPGSPAPAGGDPMAGMMQQMMNNPQMMQMAMQMMRDPQAMQQMMQMRQMMGMGAPGGGMFGSGFGMPPATPAVGAGAEPVAPVAQSPEALRAQFSAQLAQLAAMGFTDEAICLRVLQQHHGRVDAAIDSLLSMA